MKYFENFVLVEWIMNDPVWLLCVCIRITCFASALGNIRPSPPYHFPAFNASFFFLLSANTRCEALASCLRHCNTFTSLRYFDSINTYIYICHCIIVLLIIQNIIARPRAPLLHRSLFHYFFVHFSSFTRSSGIELNRFLLIIFFFEYPRLIIF